MRCKNRRSPIMTFGLWMIPLVILASAILAYGQTLAWYVITYLMTRGH